MDIWWRRVPDCLWNRPASLEKHCRIWPSQDRKQPTGNYKIQDKIVNFWFSLDNWSQYQARQHLTDGTFTDLSDNAAFYEKFRICDNMTVTTIIFSKRSQFCTSVAAHFAVNGTQGTHGHKGLKSARNLWDNSGTPFKKRPATASSSNSSWCRPIDVN